MPKKRGERSLAGAAILFAALGDPTRLALLQQLSDGGPASISMLAERFRSMTRQGMTKHLRVLAAAGIIDGSRQGREQVWALNPTRLAEGRRCLEVITREWDDALARLKLHVEERLRPCRATAMQSRSEASASVRAGGGAPAPVKKS